MKIKVELIVEFSQDVEIQTAASQLETALVQTDNFEGSEFGQYVNRITVTRVETHN